jgi:Ca2+-binding EF-hand superfamily protein
MKMLKTGKLKPKNYDLPEEKRDQIRGRRANKQEILQAIGSKIDTNGDGNISKDELLAVIVMQHRKIKKLETKVDKIIETLQTGKPV